MLNGRPYYLRGTNVCIFRFFEDPARGDLPWREEWVRRLHSAFRGMHWNAARYCIGFPPDRWYDVADELGLMIQDEFPLWYWETGAKFWPPELTSGELAREYTEWMQQRWNHPCVVIWDAQNESRRKRRAERSGPSAGWTFPTAPGTTAMGRRRPRATASSRIPTWLTRPGFRLSKLAQTFRRAAGQRPAQPGKQPDHHQ